MLSPSSLGASGFGALLYIAIPITASLAYAGMWRSALRNSLGNRLEVIDDDWAAMQVLGAVAGLAAGTLLYMYRYSAGNTHPAAGLSSGRSNAVFAEAVALGLTAATALRYTLTYRNHEEAPRRAWMVGFLALLWPSFLQPGALDHDGVLSAAALASVHAAACLIMAVMVSKAHQHAPGRPRSASPRGVAQEPPLT